MLVLGIETSCDETATAIVEDGERILSSYISSSLDFHKRFGGIIPEAASRHHLEFILPLLDECIKKAKVRFKDLDLIAVTYGPGLVGSLMVGLNLAKALSFSLGIPLVAVNHLQAHLYGVFLGPEKPELPAVGLIVSGGHTELVFMRKFDNMELLGKTRDDACGEAFDKVAKILGLGFPGGPVIDQLARGGDKSKIKFSCGKFKNSLDFSFSGIKTAVLYYVKANTVNGKRLPAGKAGLTVNEINDICAGFQEAVVDGLVENARRACVLKKTKQLILGGGVSANSSLRERISTLQKTDNIKVFLPPLEFCLDNAAIVAGLGYRLYKAGKVNSDLSLEPEPILAIGEQI